MNCARGPLFLVMCSGLLHVGCASTAATRPLLFQATMPGDSEDIFALNVASGVTRRITQGHTDFASGFPAWSPDGRRVAFVRQSQTERDALFVLQVTSGYLYEIPTPPLNVLGPPAWSPDGTEILISAGEDTQRRRLYRVKSDGSEYAAMSLPPGMFDCGSYSPDDHRVSASRSSADSSQIVVVDLTTSRVDVLLASDSIAYHCPEWAPSGDVIGITEYSRDYRQARLALVEFSTGRISYIPAGPGYNNALKWSRDGSFIVYQCTEFQESPSNPAFYQHMELCLVRPDGSDRRRLTHNDHFDAHPSW